MKAARSTARCDLGFTLLEMMVALAIVAIASIVVMQVKGRGPAGVSLQSAALQLAADMRTARAEAMRTNRPTSVVVDLSSRSFQLDGARVRRLPANVSVSASGRNLVWRSASQVAVQFRADGSSNGGRFSLQAGGRKIGVFVDWLTGATGVDSAS